MRIYGKTKDYYDSAAGMGIDTTIHYVRKEKLFYTNLLDAKIPENILKVIESDITLSKDHDAQMGIIGFCGRFYPVLEVWKERTVAGERISTYIYTEDQFEKYFSGIEIKENRWDVFNRYGNTKKGIKQAHRLVRFLNTIQAKDDVFVEINVPVFSIGLDHREDKLNWSEQRLYGKQIIANPLLKDYQFYKIKDSFQAFQEISMYLSNQLIKVEKMPEFDDKLKVHQHGFNERSFRHPVRLKDL